MRTANIVRFYYIPPPPLSILVKLQIFPSADTGRRGRSTAVTDIDHILEWPVAEAMDPVPVTIW